jgi:hypothetical protein
MEDRKSPLGDLGAAGRLNFFTFPFVIIRTLEDESGRILFTNNFIHELTLGCPQPGRFAMKMD